MVVLIGAAFTGSTDESATGVHCTVRGPSCTPDTLRRYELASTTYCRQQSTGFTDQSLTKPIDCKSAETTSQVAAQQRGHVDITISSSTCIRCPSTCVRYNGRNIESFAGHWSLARHELPVSPQSPPYILFSKFTSILMSALAFPESGLCSGHAYKLTEI